MSCTPADGGPTICLEGVYKCFWVGEVPFPALNGVDLTIHPGEMTVLAGRSGSGKTTLLNVIGALERADRGRVTVCGHDIGRWSRDRQSRFRRDHIGFVFQAYNLVRVLTARENVAYVCQLQGRPRGECQDLAGHWLDVVGLGDLTERRPDQLSGGQQQRVAVARALATDPDIVLADEPTANLDTLTARDLLGLLQRLNDDYHTTFLISSHDPDVKEAARRQVDLADGRVAGADFEPGATPRADQVCPLPPRPWYRRWLGGRPRP